MLLKFIESRFNRYLTLRFDPNLEIVLDYIFLYDDILQFLKFSEKNLYNFNFNVAYQLHFIIIDTILLFISTSF